MRATGWVTATAELLSIFPAVLFMTALFLRNVQPQEYEPAHTAQQIVIWYAARQRTGLWLFLVALPLMVLITGSLAILRRWRQDGKLRQAAGDLLAITRNHLTTMLIAGASLAAAGVLGIVALHVLSD